MQKNYYSSFARCQRLCVLIVLSFLLGLTTPGSALEHYIPVGRIDGLAILPPPPVPGTPEHDADLACARLVFKGRTSDEGIRATKDAKLTIFNFTPAIGAYFQPGRFPKTEKFFQDIKPQIKELIDPPKDHWQRKRPYQVDQKLTFGKPEPSFSYPSGHSTVGTIQAFLLADLFPEKREAILQIGRNIGWDRVLIGKHFPTDVFAGRVLGQAIAREFLASPAYQRDIAEIRAELAAGEKTN